MMMRRRRRQGGGGGELCKLEKNKCSFCTHTGK